MTQVAIQEQVEAIKKATEKAAKSKESARKFLIDAGIISEGGSDKKTDKSKQKK